MSIFSRDSGDQRLTGEEAGLRLGQLMLFSQTWVHRRVEAIRLSAAGATRRTVSLDITIPQQWAIPGSKGRVLVPIALLRKENLRGLNTSGPAGAPLNVLGAQQNSELAFDMLKSLAPDRLKKTSEFKTLGIKHLKELAGASAEDAADFEESFRQWIGDFRATADCMSAIEEAELEVFMQFAVQLSENFIFIVELDETLLDCRTVVKFSYDTEFKTSAGANRSATFYGSIADFGFSASHHMEIEVPSGLVVESLEMIDISPGGIPLATDRDFPDIERCSAHTAISPSSRLSSGVYIVEVVPAFQGIYAFTMLSLALVTMAVGLALIIKYDAIEALHPDITIPSPSASILLIGPALLLSWFARSPEHALTAQLLEPLRRILYMCAVVLILMATGAAVPLIPKYWDYLWGTIGFFTLIAWFSFLNFEFAFLRLMQSSIMSRVVRSTAWWQDRRAAWASWREGRRSTRIESRELVP